MKTRNLSLDLLMAAELRGLHSKHRQLKLNRLTVVINSNTKNYNITLM